MPRPPSYPPEIQAAILAEWDAGEPVDRIAERYGTSRSYPQQVARKNGRGPRRMVVRSIYSQQPPPAVAIGGQGVGKRPGEVVDEAEVLRLSRLGLGPTRIAALTRAPYREIARITGEAR